MPTGKLTNPDGPGAQATLGQVLSSEENIYPFHNTADLKKDEPVIFEIEIFHVNLYGSNIGIPIARLEEDDAGNPKIKGGANGKWDDDFKRKWDKEWKKVDPDKVLKLNIKNNQTTKDELMTYTKNDNGVIKKLI